MPAKFKGGLYTCQPHGKLRKDGTERKGTKYLRVTAGPQRGRYVHDLIMEAVLGRRLEGDETVEHLDGNGLNVDVGNLRVVEKRINTTLRHQREQRQKREEEEIAWENQF